MATPAEEDMVALNTHRGSMLYLRKGRLCTSLIVRQVSTFPAFDHDVRWRSRSPAASTAVASRPSTTASRLRRPDPGLTWLSASLWTHRINPASGDLTLPPVRALA